MNDDELTLRPAGPDDYGFCEFTYFEPLQPMIAELGVDEVRRRTRFPERWQIDRVRIALRGGQVIGWVQTAPAEDALFIVQAFCRSGVARTGDRRAYRKHAPCRGSAAGESCHPRGR